MPKGWFASIVLQYVSPIILPFTARSCITTITIGMYILTGAMPTPSQPGPIVGTITTTTTAGTGPTTTITVGTMAGTTPTATGALASAGIITVLTTPITIGAPPTTMAITDTGLTITALITVIVTQVHPKSTDREPA